MRIPRFHPRRVLLLLTAWASVSVVFTAVQASVELNPNKPILFLLFSNGVHFGIWALTLPLLITAVNRFPLQKGKIVRHALVLFSLSLIIGFVVSILFPAIVRSIWFPIRSEVATGKSFLQQGLFVFLQTDLLTCILIICVLHAWRLWQAYQAERLRASELEGRLATAHLEALRMQLHPHFLFNTLHSIAGLVSQDAETAPRMIVALGDFLRLTLEDRATAMRPLCDEMEFIRLYIAIEQMRLGNRMTVEYDVDREAADAMLPYLILQPLVENAIRHGVARISRSSALVLRAHRVNGNICLAVENDGPQGSCEFKPGVGISNTLERLRLLYDENFRFKLTSRPEGGCLATLTIPFRGANQNESSSDTNIQPNVAHSHR